MREIESGGEGGKVWVIRGRERMVLGEKYIDTILGGTCRGLYNYSKVREKGFIGWGKEIEREGERER